MRLSGRVLFTGAVALIGAWALVETVGWPIKTALYPRAVGIPLLILAAAETVLSLRGKEAAGAGEAMDVALSEEVPPDVAVRRTAAILIWTGGFYLAVALSLLVIIIIGLMMTGRTRRLGSRGGQTYPAHVRSSSHRRRRS